jgi:hypothetical protein
MVGRAIACGFLLLASCVYGQDNPLERPVSDFNSKGVGLTETLLKFSHQQNLRIAIEYVDRASMNQPINVSLQNKTVRQALDSILRNGHGYSWRLKWNRRNHEQPCFKTCRRPVEQSDSGLRDFYRRNSQIRFRHALVESANCPRPKPEREGDRRTHHGGVIHSQANCTA